MIAIPMGVGKMARLENPDGSLFGAGGDCVEATGINPVVYAADNTMVILDDIDATDLEAEEDDDDKKERKRLRKLAKLQRKSDRNEYENTGGWRVDVREIERSGHGR